MNGIHNVCIICVQSNKNNRPHFDSALFERTRQNIRFGASDRAAEAKQVGRRLKQHGDIPNLDLLCDDVVHELLTLLKAPKDEPMYAKLDKHLWSNNNAAGKMMAYSTKRASRLQASQLECIKALAEEDCHQLERTIRDFNVAAHRFHSICNPWGFLVMIFLAFARVLSVGSLSDTFDEATRDGSSSTLRAIAGQEEQAYMGMLATYTQRLLPIIDVLQSDFQDAATVADYLSEIRQIGKVFVIDANILSKSQGMTCLRVMMLQMKSGHVFHFGNDAVIAFNWVEGPGQVPLFLQRALERMQSVVALVNKQICESLDEVSGCTKTNDQHFTCFNLNRFGAKKEQVLASFEKLCAFRNVDHVPETSKLVGKHACKTFIQEKYAKKRASIQDFMWKQSC